MPAKITIDSARLLAAANALEADMVRFLRDLVAIPGESSHEGPVVQRIKQEMERVGFAEIRIDAMGNVLGRIGSGKHVIMMDAHTDTKWRMVSSTDAAPAISARAWPAWFTRAR
jgi:putative aminopeptidase FrvX